MGRPASGEAAESLRLETARRPADARSRRAHTTRLLRAPEVPSRLAGSRPERGEVSPLVVRVERQTVVRRVGSVDLTRAMTGKESTERLIDQRGIRKLRTRPTRRRKQLLVDGGADPDARHTLLIPQMWHDRGIVGSAPRRADPDSGTRPDDIHASENRLRPRCGRRANETSYRSFPSSTVWSAPSQESSGGERRVKSSASRPRSGSRSRRSPTAGSARARS